MFGSGVRGMAMNTNVYLEVLKRSFQQLFTYKANSYLNILGAVTSLFIQISLWHALMGNRGPVDGISFQNMFHYLIINTLVLSLVDSNSGDELGMKIRDGSIAIDLIRPISMKYFLFFQDLGKNLFKTVFTVLPVCLFSFIFFDFKFPSSPVAGGLFFVSIINGILIIFYINYIFGLLAFWLHTTWYIPWYTSALFRLFGGTFVPLWFYPPFLQRLCNVLPFRLVTFAPIEIFLERLTLRSSVFTIASQGIWIFILLIIERILWNLAQKKIIVQGG